MAFKRRWPLELRDACIGAALDRGWTATAVHAAAVDGRLQHAGQLLAPADVPIGTVRDWVRVARADRGQLEAAAAGPDAVLSRHVAETVALLDRARAKTRRALERGKAGAPEIAALARAGVEVARLVRAVHGPGSSSAGEESGAPPAGKPSGESGAAATPGFLERLAREET